MKDFIQRNVVLVTSIAAACVVLALVLGILLVGAKQLQEETLKRYDKPTNSETDAIGKQGRISQRSKVQIDTMLSETPHILGGWVALLNFGKLEVPIVYYWAGSPVVTKFIDDFSAVQLSGKGNSSEELDNQSSQSLRNSEEAKTGLIKCGRLATTNISKLSPGIEEHVKGICRATIPPFSESVNMGIVILTDIDGDSNGPEIQAIRRILLQLQIDIFNRDYQGRETWARSIATPTP